MKNNVIANAIEKVDYSKVTAVYGRIKYTKNSNYGYTAKVESMQIETSDGDNITFENWNTRKYVHSGCGYDKSEHAIHTILSKYVQGIPSTCNFPKMEYHTMSGRDFFRSHIFKMIIENPEKMHTIEIF